MTIWQAMNELMAELRGMDTSKPLGQLLKSCPPGSRAHRLAATSCRCTCGAVGSLVTAVVWVDDGGTLTPVCAVCEKPDGLTIISDGGGVH